MLLPDSHEDAPAMAHGAQRPSAHALRDILASPVPRAVRKFAKLHRVDVGASLRELAFNRPECFQLINSPRVQALSLELWVAERHDGLTLGVIDVSQSAGRMAKRQVAEFSPCITLGSQGYLNIECNLAICSYWLCC